MPGLKTGVENDIFWSEIGPCQELENRAAHPHQEFSGVPPPRVLPEGKGKRDEQTKIKNVKS